MRKNLLTLGSLAVSLMLSAQTTTVITYLGAESLVTVNDGALVYSGGGWKNATNSVINNTGDIMVVGDDTDDVFEVYTATTGSAAFNLKMSDTSVYGQLYITGIPQTRISGVVNKEYKADSNNSTLGTLDYEQLGRQQVALPFIGYTIGDLKRDLGSWINVTDTGLYYAGRFNVASVFKWHNSRVRFDQIVGADTDVLKTGLSSHKPYDYYILPRRTQSADGTTSTTQWDAAATLKTFIGTPASDEDTNTLVSLTHAAHVSQNGSIVPVDMGINGYKKNAYYETYNSYLVDPFRPGGAISPLTNAWDGADWDDDFGRNMYQFGNPFLTNLDLSNIIESDGNSLNLPDGEVVGVAVIGAAGLNWDRRGTNYHTGNINVAEVDGGAFQAGDLDVLLIKPMGEFHLKMEPLATVTDTRPFSMKNARRFSQEAEPGNDYAVASRTSAIPADKVVKQVAVVLRDSSGNELGRTYYAVSQSVPTGYNDEQKLQSYVRAYPIYTKEELPGGGEDTSRLENLYINAANEIDFAGKKIPLVIENEDAASISFEVYEAGKRLQNGAGLSTGKSFYIKKDNTITKINDGSSIAFAEGSYGLYYDTPSEETTLASSDVSLYQTVVAKKQSDWVIRFAKDWKTADVEVYSAAGQLVHSNKKVSTSQDYIIPLNTSVNGMFIVKTTSDKGEVVTKKIVK
ncbi:MAG: T9SS type A sorting domain-containing protein [Bergeyella sp.]